MQTLLVRATEELIRWNLLNKPISSSIAQAALLLMEKLE
jgi:hypothetical protein